MRGGTPVTALAAPPPRRMTLLPRAVAVRRRPAPAPTPERLRERATRRRVAIVWCLLVLNVMTFYGATWSGEPLLLPIPHRIGQLLTQGALPLALGLALTVNRPVLVRPNAFLCLLSLLVVEALVAALGQPTGHVIGTLYRTTRLGGFVCVLWLLTRWWGRRDLLLLKCHLLALAIALGTVLFGLVAAPGRALAGHRLSGIVWPMPPTEVADLAAAMIGLVAVLWLCRLAPRRLALTVVLLAGPLLVLARARTELIGMMAGVVVASVSLFSDNARVRRFFTGAGLVLSIAVTTLSGFLTAWLARGQQADQLSSFTGRTEVWVPLLAFPRDQFQELAGFGLSNKSFNGLPIDSNWLAAYWDLGLIGVGVCAALLLFVLVNAYLQPRGPQRALAVFLVTYLLVRSFTETGLTDASVNLLELAMAASFLVPPAVVRGAAARARVPLRRTPAVPSTSAAGADREPEEVDHQ